MGHSPRFVPIYRDLGQKGRIAMAKWVNPERQAQLVKLFLESHGFCVHGFTPCQGKWEWKTLTLCAHGKPCGKPVLEGELCQFKPCDGKPHLPCKVFRAVKLIWHCGYGDYPCSKPYDCHYELVASRLIREWVSDSRSQDNAEWQAERKALHALGERREPVRGRFNGISRDIFALNQPDYYLEGLGISGLTFKPFAKVRIASSYMRLYIDLGDNLKAVSKNKRRKAVRYGKPLPKAVDSRIDLTISKAVRHYQNR